MKLPPASSSSAHERTSFALTALHLALLFGLAVAQPLYDVLGRHAELFVARRTPPWQVWLLVAVVSLALPALWVGLVAALRPLGRRVADAAALLSIGALAAATALPALGRLDLPARLAIFGALGAGAVAVVLYRRWAVARAFLTVLSPAVLVFPAVFLFLSPVASVLFPERGDGEAGQGWTRTPVVIVVFDLLPVTALMDRDGAIDGALYPGFARLASDAVWFRQARTVAPTTSLAVPALLTGRSTTKGTLPIVEEYPENLFTLVDDRVRTRIFESMTWLCPESRCGDAGQPAASRFADLLWDAGVVYLHVLLPGDLTGGLPAVDQQWYGFGRLSSAPPPEETPAPLSEAERARRLDEIRALRREISRQDRVAHLERFLDGLPETGPSLSYLHLNLPHGPFVFLPSGRRYVDPEDPHWRGVEMIQGQKRRGGQPRWGADDALVDLAYRRLLLQLGFTDRLLGRILDRLEALDLYEPALLVVVADHGQSYRPDGWFRDMDDGGTLHVPMFVKVPYGRSGAIDDRSADLRDVLPTIAGVLGVKVPWPMEGHSLLDPERLERLRVDEAGVDGDRLPRGQWPSPLLERDLERKLARVGDGDWTRVYAAGPLPELLGLSIDAISEEAGGAVVLAPGPAAVAVDLRQSAALAAVDPASGFVPAYLIGQVWREPGVEPPGVDAPIELAIAVDGVIRATARAFERGESLYYAALIEESVLAPDAHSWTVYIVEREGARLRLAEAGRRS